MAENKTAQISRNVLSLISKNVAKTKKLHKSNSLPHKTTNLNVNSQSSRTEWYNRLLVAFMFLLKLLKEIPRITIITKPKTLSFSALNMSKHNVSFEENLSSSIKIFFKWFLFIAVAVAVAVAGSCFRPKLYFIRTRLISISETAYFSC